MEIGALWMARTVCREAAWMPLGAAGLLLASSDPVLHPNPDNVPAHHYVGFEIRTRAVNRSGRSGWGVSAPPRAAQSNSEVPPHPGRNVG